MVKKNLTLLYVREKISNSRYLAKKILTQVKSPIPHIEVGGRGGFDTFKLVNVIHQQNGWRVFIMWWFSRPKFWFQVENTPIKDTNGKRKFKSMLSFLFVDKRELFAMKLCSRNSTLFSSRRIRALGLFDLFSTNQGSEASEETWGTFCILYGQGMYV